MCLSLRHTSEMWSETTTELANAWSVSLSNARRARSICVHHACARSGQRNVNEVEHDATHLLCFNLSHGHHQHRASSKPTQEMLTYAVRYVVADHVT